MLRYLTSILRTDYHRFFFQTLIKHPNPTAVTPIAPQSVRSYFKEKRIHRLKGNKP